MSKTMSMISGSTADRRVKCPGSYYLEKQMPVSTSEYAATGTALHKAAELFLRSEYYSAFVSGEHLVGSFGAAVFEFFMQPEREREQGDVVITEDLIKEKLTPALVALMTEVLPPDCQWWSEKCYTFLEGNNYIDIVGESEKGDIYIVDFKFGDGVPVSAEYNEQLKYYAAAHAATHATYATSNEKIPRDANYHLVIIQPRLGFEDELVSTWTVKRGTAVGWAKQFEAARDFIASLAGAEKHPYGMGSHCRFCRANMPSVCPAKRDVFTKIAEASAPTKELDLSHLGRYLDLADEAEKTIANLRKVAQDELEKGKAVEGRKLVAKRAVRHFNDVDAAEKMLIEMGVDPYAPRKLLSPAQAEKQVGKKAYNDRLEPLVSKVSSGVTMVKESDKRPSVIDMHKVTAERLAGIEHANFKQLEVKQ